MKPILLVLAAGMGSRYGGLKQLDGLGPNGETIMDYSIYDAIRSGFRKAIFIIRKEFEDDFREKILSKYEGHIATAVAFQTPTKLPEGIICPPERTKPWGTNHAVLMAKKTVHQPFGVINADDFYGYESFATLSKELSVMTGKTNSYCMIGFRVGNTLSESGPVARGVCETDGNGYLTGITERTSIERVEGKIQFTDERGETVMLSAYTPVSMNMWGFTPDYFDASEAYFRKFLERNLNNPKSEYYIPLMVNELITKKKATVRILDTTSKWFGVTYAEDRQHAVDKIRELIDNGDYPEKLFGPIPQQERKTYRNL